MIDLIKHGFGSYYVLVEVKVLAYNNGPMLAGQDKEGNGQVALIILQVVDKVWVNINWAWLRVWPWFEF